MLTKEQNERLTRVGPGTPMGELLRRYWFPVTTSQALAENPVRTVKLLGETFTLYRDKSGRLGLVAQRCAHRSVDLKFGIPEEEGLRCPYHGWLYDASGQCLEMPAESPESTFAERVKIRSHVVEELAGLIWAYIGPGPVPFLPRWGLLVVPNGFRMIGSSIVHGNWLQCQENSADSVHLEWDHGYWGLHAMERYGITDERRWETFRRAKRHHVKLAFEPYEYGILKYRLQEGEDEATAQGWNHGHPLIFPNVVHVGALIGEQEFQIRVPLDDVTTWHVVYHVYEPGPDVVVPEQDPVPAFEVPLVDLPEWFLQQDLAVWEAQGPITDRTVEKLTETDKGLILLRRMLEEQIQVVEDGGDPINVFRQPHDSIGITIENFGDMSEYVPGSAYYGNTGTISGDVIKQVDELLTQARDAALARKRV